MITMGPPNTPSFDRHVEKAAIEKEIKANRRAVLIVNTRSRRGARAYSHAKRLLTERGMTLDASYPVRHAERLPEIVGKVIADGHKFIIIGGGDGTISSSVGHFAYGKVVLGLLPLGTANSFARTLGIPLDLAGAVDVLIEGKVADIDLGKINDDYFANGCSIGLPAAVGRATPHGLKKWLGRAAYVLVATREFLHHRSFRCTIVMGGDEISLEALDARIASGSYQGGVLVARDAQVDDGAIALHVLVGSSKWALVQEWSQVALGVPFDDGNTRILKASEFTLRTEPRMDVAIDGEVTTRTPIQVSVAREALLLMTPKAFDDLDETRAGIPGATSTARRDA